MSEITKELDHIDREINHRNIMEQRWLRSLRLLSKENERLAARVEALEKRQQQAIAHLDIERRWWSDAGHESGLNPDPYNIANSMIASLSIVKSALEGEPVEQTVTLEPAASGGPKREAVAELLFALESALPWVEAADKNLGGIATSSNGGPVAIKGLLAKYDWDHERWNHVGQPAPPDAGTQEAEARPMHPRYVEMANALQSCVRRHNLGRCGEKLEVIIIDELDRLKQQPPPPAAPERQGHDGESFHAWWQALVIPGGWSANTRSALKEYTELAYRFGRSEQAVIDAAQNHPAQWRDAAKLVDKWRADADSVNRDAKARGYTSGPYQERSAILRHCADELAALLPPEKEPKS